MATIGSQLSLDTDYPTTKEEPFHKYSNTNLTDCSNESIVSFSFSDSESIDESFDYNIFVLEQEVGKIKIPEAFMNYNQDKNTNKNTLEEVAASSRGDGLHQSSEEHLSQIGTTSSSKIMIDETTSDQSEEARKARPTVTTKRRACSTIRRIQDKIRREQLKDMIGGNLTEAQMQECYAASTANAVDVVKNARRQRSKSRTKYGKMKCDQFQRPYRRWLGVSTCVASDTRFIVDKHVKNSRVEESKNNNETEESQEIGSAGNIKTACPVSNNTEKTALLINVGDCHEPSIDTNFKNHPPSSKHKPEECQHGCSLGDKPIIRSSSILDKTCPKHHKKQLRFRESKISNLTNDSKEKDGQTSKNSLDQCDGSTRHTTTKLAPTTGKQHEIATTSKRDHHSSSATRPLSEPVTVFVGDNTTTPKEPVTKQPTHDQGGLAGKAISDVRYEFVSDPPPTPPLELKPRIVPGEERIRARNSLRWEMKTFKDQSLFQMVPPTTTPANKQSTLKSLTKRLRKAQGKPEYINAQAIKDSVGRLPGQLSFRKGQLIKQLDTGLNPVDGMYYGYYRMGKLRRKMWGIYPSSHVSFNFDTSSDDEEDNGDNKKDDNCGGWGGSKKGSNAVRGGLNIKRNLKNVQKK